MKRRNFFRLLGVGAVATIVAPKLLIPKEPVKINPMQVYGARDWSHLKNGLSTIRNTYPQPGRSFTLYTGELGYKQLNDAIKQIAVQNGQMSLTQYLNSFK